MNRSFESSRKITSLDEKYILNNNKLTKNHYFSFKYLMLSNFKLYSFTQNFFFNSSFNFIFIYLQFILMIAQWHNITIL